MKKEKTGYPTIDRPHEKYYRTKPIREFDVETNLYNFVFGSNKNNMELDALGYMGSNWTFEELKAEVDKTARAFENQGVKPGDVVIIAMINTPEVALNLLALNKIGAISKWLDVRASGADLTHFINEHDAEVMVSLDMVAGRVEEIINDTNLKQVLTVSPADSLNAIKRVGYKIKNKLEKKPEFKTKNNRFVSFKEFTQHYNDGSQTKNVSYESGKSTVIIQSSGTTGRPKSIELSDYSFNEMMQRIAYSDMPFYPGKKLMVLVPPFVAYGLSISTYLAFSFGMKAEMYPSPDPEGLFLNMGKFNMCFAAPYHYRYLAENFDKVKYKGNESMEVLITGGDKIAVEELEELRNILGVSIVNGYGNNEAAGPVAFNPVSRNKFGSVGIPKYNDSIKIVDPDTLEELKYHEQGEICYKSESMFLKYTNNEEETSRVKKVHQDGKTWFHTGDLGYIDEDGFLFVSGRMQRVITRLCFKIHPAAIEEVIIKHPAIKECIAVAVSDPETEQAPMIFYTLKDDKYYDENEVYNELIELSQKNLKEHMVPKYFEQLDEMLYTDNNKLDFRSLEKLGEEIILSKQGHQRTR